MKQLDTNSLLTFATGILFLVLGIVCLLGAQKIQRYGVDFYNRHQEMPKVNPILGWMKTPSYVIAVRLIGIGCLGAFLLITFTFIAEHLR